VGGEKAAWE